MVNFNYILAIFGGLVLCEAAVIIAFNTKHGNWKSINRSHVFCIVLCLVYLCAVIYASEDCNRSEYHCVLFGKICAMLYIFVTMAVYFFYWVRSRMVNTIPWKGKTCIGNIVLLMITMIGVFCACCLWLPIKGLEEMGVLKSGDCTVENSRWVIIVIIWGLGDCVISVLLLILFIKPLTIIRQRIRDTPHSNDSWRRISRVTKKNRNLLIFTLLVSNGVYITISVLVNPDLQTILFVSTIDQLVTLQCITMTFIYDGLEYYYCRACFILCSQNGTAEVEQEEQAPYRAMTPSLSPLTMSLPSTSSGTINLTDEI